MPGWLATLATWTWEARLVLAFATGQLVVERMAARLLERTEATVDTLQRGPLPETAAAWAGGALRSRASDVRVVCGGEGSADGYLPNERRIQLTPAHHEGRTISAWATAAHEIGHACADARVPWIGRASLYLREHRPALTLAASTILVGNTVYRSPLADRASVMVFALAALAQAAIVIEEGVASWNARRVLAEGPTTEDHRGLATAYLGAAWGTYFVKLVLCGVSVWLALRLGAVIETQPPRVLLGTLSSAGRLLAALSTVCLVVASIESLRTLVRRALGLPEPPRHAGRLLALLAFRALAMAGLGLTVWDVPLASFHAERVLLAMAPWGVLLLCPLLVVVVPLAVLVAGLLLWLVRLAGDWFLPYFGIHAARLGRAPAPLTAPTETVDGWLRRGGARSGSKKSLAERDESSLLVPPTALSWQLTDLLTHALSWPLVAAVCAYLAR